MLREVALMPAFSLIDFIDASISMWLTNPIYAAIFCAVCLVLALRFAFVSKVRIVQRMETAEREPEPLRRVVLDATARFPPRAEDRKRVI